MSEDRLARWTWNKDDVVWDFVPDPDAPPLIKPEDLDAVRKAFENGEFDDDDEGAEDKKFEEGEHPRGQPKNAGQFAKTGAVKSAKSTSNQSAAPPLQTRHFTWTKGYRELLKHSLAPSKEEARAIKLYSISTYTLWNEALRRNKGRSPSRDGKQIAALDSYLSKASIPENITVRRGLRSTFAQRLISQALAHKNRDYTFTDFGFTSTALERITPAINDEVIISIDLPKGAQAAAIGRYSNVPAELEVLIRPGSTFQVTSVDPKKRIIKVKLIKQRARK